MHNSLVLRARPIIVEWERRLKAMGLSLVRQSEREKSALSSPKSASWTPIEGRGIEFMYAEYKSGESVEPRGTTALNDLIGE
ncbi:hypothetical protein EVAR_63381_1 [Eumeta japonica]|uniref:Uncharacterized protein n=1 Tax=Eumeta variegata TaxID=151549 RepID=A0A4C1YTB6_EUMVA|nr:hypothetical protein EVAR_63381_1 [Eumeta japonica]